MNYSYCVITEIKSANWSNCLADDVAVLKEEGRYEVLNYTELVGTPEETPTVFVRTPVFAVGELFLVDEWEREIGGHGRKPSKWPVRYELFYTAGPAITRAREVSKQ